MDIYNLTPLEEQILLAVAKQENYHATVYARASDGKTPMHMQTLDSRKVTKSISALLKELKLI